MLYSRRTYICTMELGRYFDLRHYPIMTSIAYETTTLNEGRRQKRRKLSKLTSLAEIVELLGKKEKVSYALDIKICSL